MAKIKPIVKMRSLPIRSPNRPKRGAAINVAIPGIEAMTPLIKVTFPWPPNNCWIYKLMMGLIELLEAWMINVVINIPRITWGCSSFFKICFPDAAWFFSIGTNSSWTKTRLKTKTSNKIVPVMKKVGR